MSGERISVSIEGTFASRKEAADAIEDVARDIRAGRFSASAMAHDNPVVFVTETPPPEQKGGDAT